MNRVRILYIQNPPQGGSITALLDLIRRLNTKIYQPIVLFSCKNSYIDQFKKLGTTVFVLKNATAQSLKKASKRNIPERLNRYSVWLADVYKATKKLFFFLKKDIPSAWRVAREIKSCSVDLVHHNNTLPEDRATVLAAWLAGVPQVCHVRTLQQLTFVEKFLARNVNTFIYASKAIENLYNSQGVPKTKGKVIYDALDPEPFDNIDSRQIKAVREEFGINSTTFLISNIGRLDWWKGQQYFLQALVEVVKVETNLKALIVGPTIPTPQGENYYQGLKKMVRELNLSNYVYFTGPRNDIPQIMTASDIIVHSASEPEPFGLVALEGMMASRPVIATAAGGILEIIENNVSGLLIPLKDAKAMSDAIIKLLKNGAYAEKLGKRAKESALTHFSTEKHVMAIEKVYQEILGPNLSSENRN